MKTHPGLLHRQDLQKVVPISIHGDGVAYMRTRGSGTKSLDVLSWSSLLSHSATKVTNFLMFLVVKTVAREWILPDLAQSVANLVLEPRGSG